jgi:hypothetical protein
LFGILALIFTFNPKVNALGCREVTAENILLVSYAIFCVLWQAMQMTEYG